MGVKFAQAFATVTPQPTPASERVRDQFDSLRHYPIFY